MHCMRVKFYLGKNEDCSPDGSTSDSSKRLLQRGRRKDSIYVILVKEGTCNRARIFCRKFLLVSWSFCEALETVITRKDVSAFLDMKGYKNWAHKISSWEWLKTCPASFSLSLNTSFLLFTLNSFRRVLKVSSCSSTWLVLVEGDVCSAAQSRPTLWPHRL